MEPIPTVQLLSLQILISSKEMYKIFYLILFSLCSLLVISCSTEDESSVTDTTSNKAVILNMSPFVINTTIPAGTIQGSVLSQSTDSALDGVSVSFAGSPTLLSDGTIGSETVVLTSDSDGAYSQALTLDNYTITYSKSGYLDETQSAKLETDNQTLVVTTIKLLSDSCTSGIISGTIKDAVNNNPVSGVSLSIRSGLNETNIHLAAWMLVGILLRQVKLDTLPAPFSLQYVAIKLTR